MNIKHIAYIHPTTGEIQRMDLAQGYNPPEGLTEGGESFLLHIFDELPEVHKFMEERYYDFTNEFFVARAPKPNPFSFWSNGGWDWNDYAFLQSTRKTRDILLYRSDWTQVADAPLSSEQVAEVTAYRQALRDITDPMIANPENYSTLESIPWPTKPSFLV